MLPYLVAVIVIASILSLVLYVTSRPKLPSLPRLIGPLGLTLLTWVYTLIASALNRPGNDWPLVPIIVVIVVVLIWHVWLIVKGPGRGVLTTYGVGHVGFWLYFAVMCMLRINKDSL